MSETLQTQSRKVPLSSPGPQDETSLAQERWLDVVSTSADRHHLTSWTLGALRIQEDIILDLYKQFDEYYYTHFPILEPVRSLQKLHEDSPALFWAIAFTTSRHHPDHSHLYTQMREPFQLLISNLLTSPVQILKDLQALLIVCQWPLEVETGAEDPSWMLSGFVVNAALHMGIDKVEDEVLFGHRRAKHSLGLYSRKYRRRTWMKVFQISTQLSAWHGLRPHISSGSALQSLSDFCKGETAGEIVAMTEIQRQVARNTTSLDDLTIHGPQVSLVYHLTQEMNAVRTHFVNDWSEALEINFQGASLSLLTHCLVLAEYENHEVGKNSDADHFIAMIMQRGYGAALQLIKVVKELGFASAIDPACTDAKDGGCRLLAHPKQHFRLAFQACIFLLKYLDYDIKASTSDQDAARNAVSTVYQIFKQFLSREEIQRAARTIEVLARSIIPGERRIQTMVNTRMGASLSYNAIWTAAKLRGRQHDPEFTVAVSASADSTESYPLVDSFNGDTVFPWGIWDDEAYDELLLGPDNQSFSGFPTPTDLF